LEQGWTQVGYCILFLGAFASSAGLDFALATSARISFSNEKGLSVGANLRGCYKKTAGEAGGTPLDGCAGGIEQKLGEVPFHRRSAAYARQRSCGVLKQRVRVAAVDLHFARNDKLHVVTVSERPNVFCSAGLLPSELIARKRDDFKRSALGNQPPVHVSKLSVVFASETSGAGNVDHEEHCATCR
jgi:hypothetical protein